MRRNQNRSPAQLVLELERRNPERQLPVSQKGLVEALADLLLQALGVEDTTMKGGEDEQQDHV